MTILLHSESMNWYIYKELKESPHTELSEGSQWSHQTTLDPMVSNPKKYGSTDYQ